MKGGSWGRINFPATYWLIEHPEAGVGLFDCGYGMKFFEATHSFPYSLYSTVTPVHLSRDQTAIVQLEQNGIGRLDFIIVSHFHADHIGGLLDFPDVAIYHSRTAWEPLAAAKGFQAVRQGFLPDLIPNDFHLRSKPFEDLPYCPTGYSEFSMGVDLFADGQLLVIDLDGHARAQKGLLCKKASASGNDVFLVADAAWSRTAIHENRKPNPIAYLAFDSSSAYNRTFDKLVAFAQHHPEVDIYTCHGEETGSLVRRGESL